MQLILAILAIALSFLSSTWVNAINRLSKGRARELEKSHPKPGRLLVKIAEDPPAFLTSAVLVMLLAEVSAAVLVTGLIVRSDVMGAELISILIVSLVLFQLGEIAPRTWVLERLDRVLLFSAAPVYLIGHALRPLALALIQLSRLFLLILPGRGLPRGPLSSEEEIKSMLDVAESEDVIEAEEREMIHSIFEFTDTVVREVMVPRPDMVCVDGKATLEEVLDLAMKKGYSRIPVTSGDIDNIVGIAYVKDVIKKIHGGSAVRKLASGIAREAVFVPESKKVAELLREMQLTKTHMVIVVDEYGGTAGLATLEDLLEEIVGEISDEYDREEPSVVKVADGMLRVSARLGIDELNELLGTRLPDEEWDSVGGLVGGTLGRVAEEGDRVKHDGVEFEVERVKGRRIDKVLVRSKPAG